MKALILLYFILCTINSYSAIYTVINTNDAGTGSLRKAIQDANIYPGSHTINFNIPTTDPNYISAQGIWKISLASTLPMITHSSILVDGTSQTAFAGNPNPNGPEILLDGNNQTWADFAFHLYNVSSVTVKGFIIGRFVVGIQVSGANAQNNTIAGNYIGCNYNATDTLGNTHGIYLLSGPHNNFIGGATASLRNIVSGNNHVGIRVVNSNNNTIQGNFVGLNRNGNASVRNYDGISIEGTSKYNLIGGYTPSVRNYVAGNVAYGIPVFGAGCNYNIIAGNYIGTDTTGTFAIPNTYGLLFDDGASYNTLGGRTPGAGNLLSGNSGYGVFLYNFGTEKDTVVGNLIGTDYSGTLALPNANGIVIDGPSFLHTVENNVISGNLQMGIDIHLAGTDNNVIINNKIGTDISGLLPLGNQLDGIRIGEGPKNNIIGLAGKGNIIANNGGNGITVMTSAEISNSFSSNSIYNNAGLGIDLFPTGPTPNDAGDIDVGPNNGMNFPVIDVARYDFDIAFISGTLDTQNPQFATIEIFKSDIPDSTKYGQGKTFLGTTTPDLAGNWFLSYTMLFPGEFITATATDSSGNTSEFSLNKEVKDMTGISEDNMQAINFSIYPNPFSDKINVNYTLSKDYYVEISIYSNDGKKIKELFCGNKLKGNQNDIFQIESDKTRLSCGNYLLKIKINNQIFVKPILKNN